MRIGTPRDALILLLFTATAGGRIDAVAFLQDQSKESVQGNVDLPILKES